MTNDTDYLITKSVKSHHYKLHEMLYDSKHEAGPWSQKHERVHQVQVEHLGYVLEVQQNI